MVKKEEASAVPSGEDLIGFVMMGNFNSKEGKEDGVGALVFEKDFGNAMGVGEVRDVKKVYFVTNGGSSVGRLTRWKVVWLG
jgi:hypothetical protein